MDYTTRQFVRRILGLGYITPLPFTRFQWVMESHLSDDYRQDPIRRYHIAGTNHLLYLLGDPATPNT
jgi:hypothetical protein